MIRSRRPTMFQRLSLAFAALAWIGTAPAAAQDMMDDFEILSSEADSGESVAVLVTGWHPVTGEEPDAQSLSDDGGMVAITGDEFVEAVSNGGGVSDVRRYEYLPVIAMTMDADALAATKSYNGGVQVWKDTLREPMLSDSGSMVGAHGAHAGGYTGKGVYIAVIDTGVDVKHPFLAGRPIFEACFARRCPNGKQKMLGEGAARPIGSHGTHVAGIALGSGAGMTGVAPEARLIAINVFDVFDDGKGNKRMGALDSSILAALDWLIRLAWTQPVSIAAINMSLGGSPYRATPCRQDLYDIAVNLLAQRNVLIVAASGNNGKQHSIGAPACVNGIVSVGAIDKKSKVADFSNSAPILDIVAPGVKINSAVVVRGGKSFAALSGTSMATPHVAGAFAVLRQAAPLRSLWDLHSALIGSGSAVRDHRNGITTPSLDVTAALRTLGVKVNGGTQSSESNAPLSEEENGWQAIGE